MSKDEMIKEISSRCITSYGELLVELMDRYNKNSLAELTYEEVKEFYVELINKYSSIAQW